MMKRSWLCFRRVASSVTSKSVLNPLEALTQIQLGITPPLAAQRGFMLEYCEAQLESRGVTEAKLFAMEGRLCGQLMKQLVYEKYLTVPFRVFAFDMEFTGPPVFSAEGPTEDITELGVYSPLLDQTFSCLVQPPCGRKQGPGVAELTHISDEMLEKEGVPFDQVWQQFLDFVHTPQPNELPGSGERILLLSHGGKLADVSLIKWTLEKFGLELPSSFVFGDTIHLIRDAHRRRPVTVDKHPPSWKLGDLVQWLHIPPMLPAHRAGNDAKMTWDALYHTLLRYGDDEMTPREQLIPRFFDVEAKRQLRESAARDQRDSETLMEDDTFVLADAAMRGGTPARTAGDAEGTLGELGQAVPTHSGGASRRKSSASTDLMDLDFDDIFKNRDGMQGGSGATIEEFRLAEDEPVDRANGSEMKAISEERAETPARSQGKGAKRGRKSKKEKTGDFSNSADGGVDDDVFLV